MQLHRPRPRLLRGWVLLRRSLGPITRLQVLLACTQVDSAPHRGPLRARRAAPRALSQPRSVAWAVLLQGRLVLLLQATAHLASSGLAPTERMPLQQQPTPSLSLAVLALAGELRGLLQAAVHQAVVQAAQLAAVAGPLCLAVHPAAVPVVPVVQRVVMRTMVALTMMKTLTAGTRALVVALATRAALQLGLPHWPGAAAVAAAVMRTRRLLQGHMLAAALLLAQKQAAAAACVCCGSQQAALLQRKPRAIPPPPLQLQFVLDLQAAAEGHRRPRPQQHRQPPIQLRPAELLPLAVSGQALLARRHGRLHGRHRHRHHAIAQQLRLAMSQAIPLLLLLLPRAVTMSSFHSLPLAPTAAHGPRRSLEPR